ncbi:hypothetical protein [Gimesia algae]|uniref:Uncharacterized protein n=1 Tax=Gimesia algae TaxID=2527971 RepID=A0A517VMR7_9PLAN|nr:hypothetical protein [Gimesia algae]QDT94304.1 hypothetical protein Pan161_59990 [Gimesia algae]
MTTTVTVEAHCDYNSTQVEIVLQDGTKTIIQDGQSHELHVHDDRSVTVREIDKVPEVLETAAMSALRPAGPLSAECPD